ncbi:LysR family transcriptional regulator [Aquipuribacter sp. MA13-6]|uniref:LysR family transcriptional regulator n=1 Tax=unclassified Aquipuribacter TaxID=2635084 RepID=UPI003EEC7287
MAIDVDLLRLLRAVNDEGSISAAARRLGISQPAASQQLRRAERSIGTALVERTGRRSRPTEPGRVLARHAVGVENLLAAAESEVLAVAGLAAGTVRLVAFPSASARLVPRALALLRRQHPDLRVSLAEVEPPGSLARLRDGAADVVVTFDYQVPGHSTPAALDGLTVVPLLADEVRLAVPTDGPWSAGGPVAVAELAEEEWIAGCPRCRGHLVALAAAAGFVPRIRYETDDYVAVLGLVAEGLGVALLPSLAEVHDAVPGVTTVPLAPAERRDVVAVTTLDLARVPSVAAVLAVLRTTAAGAGSSDRTGAGGEATVRPLTPAGA